MSLPSKSAEMSKRLNSASDAHTHLEVGEKAIDRVSRRRSIEATAQPDNRVPKFSLNGTNAVDVVVVAMEEAMHQFWWFVLSCSPRLRRGEHVELFEKLEGEMLILKAKSS